MSDTTFVSGTTVTASWLNDVNTVVYKHQTPIEVYGGGTSGDNYAAYAAAIAAGKTVITFGPGTYYFSQGITVSSGVVLVGASGMPGNSPKGTILSFAPATPVCVTCVGTNNVAQVQNLSIRREDTGAVPAGSIGLLITAAYPGIFENVGVFRHDIGIFVGGATTDETLGLMFDKCFTGAISDSHVVIENSPETRFSQCRFGMNGSGDVNCNSYIRIQGGSTTNAASGPNTVQATNCQFNQGQNSTATWLDFANKRVGTISDLTNWNFVGCHIEATDLGVRSDATWTSIGRLLISNCTFNSVVPFLSLNAATGIDNWSLSNLQCYGSFTAAPTPQINFLQISNCFFLGNVSLTGNTTGSVATLSNNYIAGNLTLAGTWGPFGRVVVRGGGLSGTFTNTADSTELDFSPYNQPIPATATLLVGGVSTGITQSSSSAQLQRVGKVAHVQFDVLLTNKGASTGAVTVSVTEIPNIGGAGFNIGATGSCVATGLTGVVGHVFCAIGAGPVINLYQDAATGATVLTHANLTNNSRISGCLSYFEDT